jgi:hypothetical protein
VAEAEDSLETSPSSAIIPGEELRKQIPAYSICLSIIYPKNSLNALAQVTPRLIDQSGHLKSGFFQETPHFRFFGQKIIFSLPIIS